MLSQQLFCGDPRKRFHCFNTQLLVDYDGRIIAAILGVPGSRHDMFACKYKGFFESIVSQDGSVALGDPGYQGLSWVVAGLKVPQIKTAADKRFSLVTKAEQKKIEGVNTFFKGISQDLSKETVFRLDYPTCTAVTMISLGIYNWRLSKGVFAAYFDNKDALHAAWAEDVDSLVFFIFFYKIAQEIKTFSKLRCWMMNLMYASARFQMTKIPIWNFLYLFTNKSFPSHDMIPA